MQALTKLIFSFLKNSVVEVYILSKSELFEFNDLIMDEIYDSLREKGDH